MQRSKVLRLLVGLVSPRWTLICRRFVSSPSLRSERRGLGTTKEQEAWTNGGAPARDSKFQLRWLVFRTEDQMNELVWLSQYVGLLGGQCLSKVESDKLARPSAHAPSTCGGEGRRMGRPAIDRGPKFVNPGAVAPRKFLRGGTCAFNPRRASLSNPSTIRCQAPDLKEACVAPAAKRHSDNDVASVASSVGARSGAR